MSLLSITPFAVFAEPASESLESDLALQLAYAIETGDIEFVESMLDEETYVDPRFIDLARSQGHRDIAWALQRHMLRQDLHAPTRIC